MSYRIGSFNMYKFQAYRSDDEIRKNLDKIASIIQKERFDIIALQEIFSKQAMDRLLERLGPSWTGAWDSPRARTAQAAEGYAFLWNTKRIELAHSLTASGPKTYYPRIYNQYRIDRRAGQQPLVRNPYFARFHPLHTFFEIRLFNIHIMYSQGKRDSSGNSGQKTLASCLINLSDAKMRKNEFNIIAKYIYTKEADKRYGNNMPAYTIILGDYNLNLERSNASSPYIDEIIEIPGGSKTKQIKTVQDELTTLSHSCNTDAEETGVKDTRYANNYDHFSYDMERFEGTVLIPSRIDTLKNYMGDDLKLHKRQISDHVPIALDMHLRSKY